MVPESLRAESVAVVLVDLVEGPLGSVRSMPGGELRRNAGALVEVCALLRIPMVMAKAPFPGRGGDVLPEMAPWLTGAREVRHRTNDSWETPEFVEAVKATGRQQLVFAGIATEVGVGLTALSAVRAGYQVAVLVDACGTVSERAEQAAWARLSQAGVILTTWSGFAGEVQRNYTTGKGPEVLEIVARHVFREEQK